MDKVLRHVNRVQRAQLSPVDRLLFTQFILLEPLTEELYQKLLSTLLFKHFIVIKVSNIPVLNSTDEDFYFTRGPATGLTVFFDFSGLSTDFLYEIDMRTNFLLNQTIISSEEIPSHEKLFHRFIQAWKLTVTLYWILLPLVKKLVILDSPVETHHDIPLLLSAVLCCMLLFLSCRRS